MRNPAEQPTRERAKSYDILASVNMLRYDLEHFQEIQPETRQRVCDEELSYIVEGVDKSSRTPFVLRRQDDDIVYFRQGQWESYRSLLMTGLRTAETEAAEDPRRAFLVNNAREDFINGNFMVGLRPGEQRVWLSSYEHHIEALHGADFMRQCGRQPERRMGFVYRAECQDDGSILLESQTLDQSDADGFTAIEQLVKDNPGATMDELVEVYDDALYVKTGVQSFAGRPQAEREENAWDEIYRHRDLIEFHLNKLEEIAEDSLTDQELEAATKRHTYGVWAAFKKRIEGKAVSNTSEEQVYISHQFDPHLHHLLEQETQTAFQDFAQKGIVMVGCGGGFSVAKGEAEIMQADPSDVHTSIFSSGDKFGSLTFTCPNGHHNRRKYGKLLPKCQREGCKAKVTC